MKKEQLQALAVVIKKLVREEIRREVKPIIVEEMNNQMTKLLAEVIRGGSHSAPAVARPAPQQLNEHAMVQPQPARGKTHQFNKTGNPALDSILSQTVSDITPDAVPIGDESFEMSELRKIGDTENISFQEMFAPQPAEIVIDRSSNLNMLKSLVGAGNSMNVPSALDVPTEINPIGQTLKRDFRSMMKNIDGIKGRMRSGPMAMPNIDPEEWRKVDAEG